MTPVEFKRPGAREAAVSMIRSAFVRDDLAVAFEASAIVLVLLCHVLGKDEGQPAAALAHAAVDEMLSRVGEASSVEEVLQRLRGGKG